MIKQYSPVSENKDYCNDRTAMQKNSG